MESLAGGISDAQFLGLVALAVLVLLGAVFAAARFQMFGCRLRPRGGAARPKTPEPPVWPPPPRNRL